MAIAVIGAGAAGMMAAGTAIQEGARVVLYEHAQSPGRKLGITGKGRCNVTNACPKERFFENVPRNPRFLYTAMSRFGSADVMRFFEERAVPLKVERGERVFPASDKAADIVRALRDYTRAATLRRETVHSVHVRPDGLFTINGASEEFYDRVIVATGGCSYPLTGSDGSGYRLAQALGHTLTPLYPSLVPLTSDSPLCGAMQGLALKNVGIRIKQGERVRYEDFGEMLFTHFGVSGPTILSASAHLCAENLNGMTLYIDLKPALDEATLDRRLLTDFSERANRDFIHATEALLPAKMRDIFPSVCDINPHKKVNSITKEERRRIRQILKAFPIPLRGFRPIEEAIVTRGGVDVRQIDPKTMQSKLVKGLYFAGEIIDTDAYTGGFNLQIAFATGHLAGTCAAMVH